MQSILLSPVGYEPKGDSLTAVAYSPDYSGSPFFTDEKTVNYTALKSPCCAAKPDLKNVVIGGRLGVVDVFSPKRVGQEVFQRFDVTRCVFFHQKLDGQEIMGPVNPGRKWWVNYPTSGSHVLSRFGFSGFNQFNPSNLHGKVVA